MVDEALIRVLCVDDCADAADTLGALLELAGFRARVCYGGAEAVAALDEFRPDACLIDLAMPGVDGLEVARGVRDWARGRCVPLVAITGWADPDTVRRTAEAGFDLHLVKPVDPDKLAAVLADLVILRGSCPDIPPLG